MVDPSSYPTEWEADVVLADGGTVHVRPVLPEDAERLVAFHGRLSRQSIYYRFFSPRPRLSDKEVQRFTTVDFDERMGLVALLGDEMIGIASYDRWPGRDEAEVAFTVDDAHQGRGVATVLLEHLAAAARFHGITRFTAEVLPDNRRMLGVFRSAGFEARSAFADGVVSVGMDIAPTGVSLEAMHDRERRADARSVARLLGPRSIAVIGAGTRRHTVGHEILRNLLSHGFQGPVYPVHPTAAHVASVRAWPTVLDVPDDVELAVLAVPSSEVHKVVEQCARKRVGALVIVSAGFSETGEAGLAHEREVVGLARGHGMRVLGPASMGLISTVPDVSMHATFAPVVPLAGRVAVSSQSGPLGMAILEQARRQGVGISHFVAVGNKADVSANDLLQYWETDPHTSVIALYIASFGNPRKFSRVARRVSRSKPIVAVHTAIERELPVGALFRQAGVVRVDAIGELFDVARILESQPMPRGRRIAVISNASGAVRLSSRAVEAAGLEPARLKHDTRTQLQALLPMAVVDEEEGTIDLTHTALPADYSNVMQAVLEDDGVDGVLVIFAPVFVQGVEGMAGAITRAAKKAPTKPVVASVLGVGDRMLAAESRDAVDVPSFAFPEIAAAALGRVVDYAEWRRRPIIEEPDPEALGIDLDRARRIIEHALDVSPTGILLPWVVVADLLDAFGIPLAPGRAVASVEDAVATAEAVGYPVTVKAAGMPRLARSEAGGVALDLHDAAEVRGAYERMSDSLGYAMAEALVQHMVAPGVETIVAIRHDPIFGPVVTFGLGGAFADAIADVSARALPLTALDVHDLIAGSRASQVLALGFDVDALSDLLLRVGLVADLVPEVVELRLNPVLVAKSGAVAVDAHVRVAPAVVEPNVGLRRLL